MAGERPAAGATGELVIGCKLQERSAQTEFYSRYRNEVARIVFKVLGPDPDLEDVVQDVFIEVFRSIDRFKGKSKITTWLYRVTVNVAYQRLRKRRRHPEDPLPAMEDLPDHETPHRAAERQETSRTVYRILDTLAPKKRIVFVLHEILGMDSKEISRLVGANMLTVRTRLHYARKEFYSKLVESGHVHMEISS